LAQAELQLEQHQTEQAYATLRLLHADKPANNLVKQKMLEASASLKDWSQMLTLLNEFERKGGMPIQNIRAGQLQAHAGILAAAALSGEVAELNKAWGEIPARLKKELYLIQIYVSARLKYADTSDCEPLIRDIIRDRRDPVLVRLYGLVQGKDPGKQLAFVEKLLSTYPGDSMLLLTAGRLYKRAALWGRARHCLEECLKIQPVPEACYELATMFQQQGDAGNAGKYFREGLTLATTQMPALPHTPGQ
jgi:HemY protein